MLDAMSREAELEDVTDALLLTGNDDFNALAAVALRTELGHGRVYRVAPDPNETDLLAPAGEQGILGADAVIVVTATGGLRVASDGRAPASNAGDRIIALAGTR
jgi:Trk K+ transport system NAD-binding subunit